ncbi:MAG TPA: glycosyltransferase family 10 [Pedobacter sp.]|jgi:hypothetical protein
MSDKITVKFTAPWDHQLYNHTPGNSGIIGNYKFEINNDCTDADFWIVYGGVRLEDENRTVRCPRNNIIYLTDECHEQRYFLISFLNQFHSVITPRTDLTHKNIISNPEINIWTIKKSYDEIKKTKFISKTKKLSVIASNRTELPGHLERLCFVNKLIGHFKDKIDVFGRGFNPVDDKFEALKDYEFSVAIENSAIPNYFTEKIYDCFLSNTVPIYWGCPNISDFFAEGSYIPIDIYDYKKSIRVIEEIIESDFYLNSIEIVEQQKQKYLDELHLFPGLVKILNTLNPDLPKDDISLKLEVRYERAHTIKRWVKKLNDVLPLKYQFELNFKNQSYAN